MKINLVWPGRTKEQFILDGISKYTKLLKPYTDISIIELKEEKGSDVRTILRKEGERILKLQKPYTLCDEQGEHLTSMEFAGYLSGHQSSVSFVLGGAFGVSEEVKKTAQRTIALSRMTFTHEMARLFFLEQLFRAFTIINKRGYHH
jgi:23S rRNA (pseudouridine1915-N3)-methyltransferase